MQNISTLTTKDLDKSKLTPMMLQYVQAKERYEDAIVLFRLGDFYELFYEDARTAARVLGLTLTSRDRDKTQDAVPMAGVPHHAAQGYIARLCEEGYKVAVCEQVEEPGKKGMFRREVSRVVTPGMMFDDESLAQKAENLLCALVADARGAAVASLDVSTGRFRVTESADRSLVADELLRLSPRELVWTFDVPLQASVQRLVKSRITKAELPDPRASLSHNASELCLRALAEALPLRPSHIAQPEQYELEDVVLIDDTTRRNLELLSTLIGNKREGSLLGFMDRTSTAMGARLLSSWLSQPLRSEQRIADRHAVVAHFCDRHTDADALRELLRQLYDLERLNGRLGALQATPRDLGSLRDTLLLLPEVANTLDKTAVGLEGDANVLGDGNVSLGKSARFQQVAALCRSFTSTAELLRRALVDTPPVTHKEGGVFRTGFSAEIDELATLGSEGKDYLLQMEQRERERTGIHNLKIRYNRVFGYAIEISKSQLQRIPEDYVRRQTLANAERFVTDELKRYEEKVLNADERRLALEEATFIELRAQLLLQCEALRRTAQALAELDALLSFAAVAHEGDWVRPTLAHEPVSLLQAARHPVVEAFVKGRGEAYVPCDVTFDEQAKLLLITGPNMAGKSTVLRAVALIHVLAQAGSFVPAKAASLGVCDRIFTRVGASDNLSQGQSTFMVEMAETASILRAATARSLVVVDEIGRGTSTADGLSIAWAVAEYLHDVARSRSLFATHYHELVELPMSLERVRNFHMAVSEYQGQVVFLRELRAGGASRSYGIEVARLAGLPKPVLARARELLSKLEDHAQRARGPSVQLSLFVPQGDKASPVVRRLRALEVDRMTPVQALVLLQELVSEAKGTA